MHRCVVSSVVDGGSADLPGSDLGSTVALIPGRVAGSVTFGPEAVLKQFEVGDEACDVAAGGEADPGWVGAVAHAAFEHDDVQLGVIGGNVDATEIEGVAHGVIQRRMVESAHAIQLVKCRWIEETAGAGVHSEPVERLIVESRRVLTGLQGEVPGCGGLSRMVSFAALTSRIGDGKPGVGDRSQWEIDKVTE
jgi:hypothetical protein